MCFTKFKITARMTTSLKQIIWDYIKQLLLNSWGQRRPFWSPQRGDLAERSLPGVRRTHCVPLDSHSAHPHGACCQTRGFLITLYSVGDPGSPNPASQMQNSLAEAALTGAISMVFGTWETGQTMGTTGQQRRFAPVHRMAPVIEQQFVTEAS